MRKKIADRTLIPELLRMISAAPVRAAGLRCLWQALAKFFLFQFRHALLPGRIRVARVDHALDSKIPFDPSLITIYLDFVAFWIRSAGYLIERYGCRAWREIAGFVDGIAALYGYAGKVYTRLLSTTTQPKVSHLPRFLMIRLLDPHLLCVPSLHIMIVTRTYTHFRSIVKRLGDEELLAERIKELREGALAIADSTMLVKQHSVNCIAAALYAMTRYDPELWPEAEAEAFASDLFRSHHAISENDAEAIRKHIIDLYHNFLRDGDKGDPWEKVLVLYLKTQPIAVAETRSLP